METSREARVLWWPNEGDAVNASQPVKHREEEAGRLGSGPEEAWRPCRPAAEATLLSPGKGCLLGESRHLASKAKAFMAGTEVP